ncbi:MAG: hypothetical protein EAZ57_07625 [Cytophagales bacterium]|nr:MAG: hypothetical protein EAZ67_08710 [Cytophagales bacterium]TAF60407.1 MAG: hypothetical protein EAZ57_07625 [Cytophagales bacterium]
MKRLCNYSLAWLLLAFVWATACGPQASGSGEDDQARQELEALKKKIEEDSLYMVDMQKEMEDVYGKLDEMRQLEERVRGLSSDMRGGNMGGAEGGMKIDESLAAIEQKMADSRGKIKKLEAKLKEANKENSQMGQMVEMLKKQIESQEATIKDLEGQVAALQGEVAGWKSQYLTKSNQADSLQTSLSGTTEQLNTAYYVIGTEKELKEKDIIKSSKKGFEANRNKRNFKTINIQNQKTISLGSDLKIKNIKLLPARPENSYRLSESGKVVTLEITDVDAFWQDKYLAVITKSSIF